MYFMGDKVSYIGSKFKNLKMGTIISRVQNQTQTFVVDFGEDAYVIHEKLLTKYDPSKSTEKVDTETVRKKKPNLDNKQVREFISDEDGTYVD